MKRKILSILAALSLGGPSGIVARADEGTSRDESTRNALTAVRVVREATETLVRIEGSRTPVFSVYTLAEPHRLVVDLAQGEVDKLETPMEVDDGVISKIVAAQYGEGARAVGRIIIGFSRRVPYDVKADGNTLVVRIAAVGKERPSEATLRAKDKALEERQQQLRERQQQLQAKDAELIKLREALTARADAAAEAEKRAREELAAREAAAAKIQDKDGEVAKLRQELEARAKEAIETKAAVADVEKVKSDEQARRRELERKLAEAQAQSAALREKVAGSEELQRALEASRAEMAKAAKELAALRGEVGQRAEAETRARAEAAEVARELQKAKNRAANLKEALSKSQSQAEAVERAKADAQDASKEASALKEKLQAAEAAAQKARDEAQRAVAEEKSARAEDVQRLEAASKAFAQRVEAAETRVRELAALEKRLVAHQGGEAAARELLSHKENEIASMRKKLEAAERVAKATADELDRARKREAEQLRAAENAHAVAHGATAKARETLAGAPVEAPAGAGGARVTLAKGEILESSKPIVIRNVDFKGKEGNSRVVLRVEGEPHYVVTRGERRLVLDLPGARLPQHLRRRLDVSEFGGPVRMVSAYEATNPVQATRVMVDLHGPASYEVTRNGQDLELEVKGAGNAAVAPTPRARPVLVAQAAGAPKDEVPDVLEDKKVAAPAKRAKAKKASYRGRRINLDLQDADIHTVLKLISEVIRLNFVVSDDVKGKVSMTLRDVPWDQALEIILKSKDLGYAREGNIIRVAQEKVFRAEAEEEAKREVVVKETQPVLLKIIAVNYAKADELLPRIKDVLSEKGAVSADKRTNQLIVRDVMQRLKAAERLVKKLDTQTPQVLIEARIVEANTIFTREIGIQWGGNFEMSPANGNPTGLSFPSTIGIGGGSILGFGSAQGILNPQAPNFGVNLPATTGLNQGGALGFTFGSLGGTINLNLRLSAAEETGQAKIISAPKITTLDNQKATIQQGVSIPISQASAIGINTIFVDANLTLTVTPHVTQDGSVIMDIIATKNEPDFQRTGGLGDPTIVRKEARTSVLIKDGDTTVIGGIYTRNQSTNQRGVPFLSSIPILGWLFKKSLRQDNRTELLIFITPRIVNRPDSIGS